tara:strand:+ start:186 stop:407 length:222 start_codon:yes stop_codon:yes gene_type:complete
MAEERKLVCCICDKPITPDLTTDGEVYWDQGHNPEPVSTVKGDRCCTRCNDTVITPRRIADFVFGGNNYHYSK